MYDFGLMRGLRPLYFLAIFFSAFLLFQIQPLIAKVVLPLFGGSASVWIVCLLFFQVVLLLGYLYADFLIRRVPAAAQQWIHATVFLLTIVWMAAFHHASIGPIRPDGPVRQILWLLAESVGPAYFLLSSSSPLLQAWYAQSHEGAVPYRFYALSNIGSMLALLTYPVIVEPYFSTAHQAFGWSTAFLCVSSLCVAVGFLGRREDRSAPVGDGAPFADWKTQVLWVALAACGSALLLAVTNHISQNIAAVPFLWVAPLSLYLLSFILCFDTTGWYRRGLFLRVLGVLLGGMAYALSPSFESLPIKILIPLFCAGLFACCMFCHGELARLKPDPAHLTRFYLSVASGGAIGAALVALVAPRIFSGYYELHVALAACAILVLAVHAHDPESEFRRTRWQPSWLVLIGLVIALTASLASTARDEMNESSLSKRNFYGVLRIIGSEVSAAPAAKGESAQPAAEDTRYRRLMNGTIDHGLQFYAWNRRRWATSYYGPNSGIAVALREARQPSLPSNVDAGSSVFPFRAGRGGELRAGFIGLGTGTVATYGQPGDKFTFYEINPLDVEIAKTQFTYLRESEASIDIVMGDARLSLERQAPQNFDVLAVDAFSGDSIPLHLLTRQAFELYFRHLKPDGILAVHISNKYLNLEPVVSAAATALTKKAVMVNNDDDHGNGVYAATWILVGDYRAFMGDRHIEQSGTVLAPAGTKYLWTDDYSSLLRLLK
jgi:hypothetical protein